MNVSEKLSDVAKVLLGWGRILSGRVPLLSVEITKECPLACPGCYAYGEEHLRDGLLLRSVADYRGDELVEAVLALVDKERPIHMSIVGGEPLVRFRELDRILPILSGRDLRVQLVTSAVRQIPPSWAALRRLSLVVSIDGLQPEHDARRKPATYERILRNIEGHRIIVHCTITRQMCERPGYLNEFLQFWSGRRETKKIWMSLYTPQVGEVSPEILTPPVRSRVLNELMDLRRRYPKLQMPEEMIRIYANPPSSPSECIFARTTRCVTADFKTTISPCQFGGNPDCSQCGCVASAGLAVVGHQRLPGGIQVGHIFEQSLKVGNRVAELKNRMENA